MGLFPMNEMDLKLYKIAMSGSFFKLEFRKFF